MNGTITIRVTARRHGRRLRIGGARLQAVHLFGLGRRARRVARGVEARVAAPVTSRRIGRWIDDCEPLLRTSARRRNVVILVSTRQRRAALACVRRFKGDRVLVLGVRLPPVPGVASREAADLDAIYAEIRQFGTPNVLIDLRPVDAAAHREAWEHLVFHLAHGGVFVGTRPGGRARLTTRDFVNWAAALSSPVAPDSALERGRRDAFSGLVMLDHVFVIRKKGQHFLAVGDDEVEALLPKREPSMKVTRLHELPGGEFASRARVTSHESAVAIEGFPARIGYPGVRLRHYAGPMTFAGRTLLFSDQSILPDSFRFYRAHRLDHPVTGLVTDEFHAVPMAQRAKRDLEGDYFLLDPQWTGHFGHIMTEVVGRLWAWDEAKRQFPDLKALFAVPRGRTEDEILSRLLPAYGIPESDLVAVNEPVRVRSVLGAMTMWHNQHPHFVHPDIAQTWARISPNIADPDAPTYDRVFVSRSDAVWARKCHNLAEVEEFFAENGFTIVYPEKLDLAVQAAIFRSARVIAGFGSSAMCNLMYAENLQRLIVLTHEAYTARNEYLYASVVGADVDYFWSTPDVPRDPLRYNPKAFVSDWSFDFERNRVPLEKVLSEV
jgi:capsular polysaccharide biosynthesis protein